MSPKVGNDDAGLDILGTHLFLTFHLVFLLSNYKIHSENTVLKEKEITSFCYV